jgi:hypothetical protein
LLLPSWKGQSISPAIKSLASIEDFGESEVIAPISADELNTVVLSLQPGVSVSFVSAAGQYNNHIDECGPTQFPIATFDLSSTGKLMFFRKLVHYAIVAGGPFVWRELQCAFSNGAREEIEPSLLSDVQSASLADDLYAVPCSRFGWPLKAFRQFDRQMLAAFRRGGAE